MNAQAYRNMLSGMFLFWIGCLSTVAAADCALTKELAFSHAEIGTVQVFRDASCGSLRLANAGEH